MYPSLLVCPPLSTVSAVAKQCSNITVRVSITARNGGFKIPALRSNVDALTFIQNPTSVRGNFTMVALLDNATVTVELCKSDAGSGISPTLQVLTPGLGFRQDVRGWYNVCDSYDSSDSDKRY